MAKMIKNTAREKLIQMYIDSLKEGEIPWRKGWDDGIEAPQNPVSNIRYKGVNILMLSYVAVVNEYDDPRWCTFKQANDKGWKIKAGEHGTPIEYSMPFNKKTRKFISWKEYETMKQDKEKLSDYYIGSKISIVFNAQQIEGIPVYERKENKNVQSTPFIENLIKKMNVGYMELGTRAYYQPSKDVVVVPKRTSFYSDYEYNATRLHELCHATGHTSRLDRLVANRFGSADYAKEELRAEIASSFIGQSIGLMASKSNLENHKAYIQSWIEVLQKEPNELFKAIQDAEEIEEYVLDLGGPILENNFKDVQDKNVELPTTSKELKDIVYSMYKESWVCEHISIEQENKTFESYREFVEKENDPNLLFDEYVDEFGYNGELYSSYEEFIENEYMDKEYISSLLKENLRDDLLSLYFDELQQDIIKD